MVLILHIRFAYMRVCAFIHMSLLPAAWIAVGCLLLVLLLVVTVMLLLKSREASTLKKEVLELRDTMRMMRYEEANLARMLHTAKKTEESVETEEEPCKVEMFPKTADDDAPSSLVVMPEEHKPLLAGKEEETEIASEDNSDMAVEHASVIAEQNLSSSNVTDLHEFLEDDKPQVVAAQSRRQGISERRPAIPNDLFAAWFAENEDYLPGEETMDGVDASAPVVVEKDKVSAVSSEKQNVDVKSEANQERFDGIATAAQEAGAEGMAVDSDQSDSSKINREDERFCRKLERIVNTRMRNPNLNIDIIAAQLGLGRTNFYRKVRELTGMSPNDYLRKCRMERAAELLCSTETAVNDVCAQVGVPDAQYFSRVFKAYFGMPPSTYREQHQSISQ